MNKLHNRLNQLEKRNKPAPDFYVLIYDKNTGLIKSGHPLLIGKTRAQAAAMVEPDATVINVVTAGAVYIPDNGRADG